MIALFRDSNFDFVGRRRWAYVISILFILAGLGVALVPRSVTQLQRPGVIYRALPAEFSCSRSAHRNVLAIDQAYYSQAAPVIDAQIRKAGIRLARVLNEAFAAASGR